MTTRFDISRPDSFGRVAVLMGGCSAEREISLLSGGNVLSALQAAGVDAHCFDPKEAKQLPDCGIAQLKTFDVAFIALHGAEGEDGVMQAVLEYLGIPYTGSGVQASANGMDKVITKRLWQADGLPTPEFWVLSSEDDLAACQKAMNGALMVKPSHEGSSIGMSVAETPEALAAAYRIAAEYDQRVLVERYIEGDEFTVGVLNGRALPVIRLQTTRTFYDYEAKYQSSDTQYQIPSGLSAEEEQALQALCLKAYQRIRCRGWGRVDVMRSQDRQFWLLELNTIPGMTKKSLVPMGAKAVGLDFQALVLDILAAATLDARVE